MGRLELTTSSAGGKGHVVTQNYEKTIKPLMELMTLTEPLKAGDEQLMCFFVSLLQGSYTFLWAVVSQHSFLQIVFISSAIRHSLNLTKEEEEHHFSQV